MSPAEYRFRTVRTLGRAVDDYGPAELQHLANGPLCDALRSFCPAGRLTMADTLKREASQVERL